MYKVFVINLKRDSLRRELSEKKFRENNVEFEFIDGVYGKDLTKNELEALVDFNSAKKYYKRNISLGEIGCSLSHLKTYQKIVDDNLDGAFVFEDDILISSDIKNIINAIHSNIDKLPQNIWLGLGHSYLYTNKKLLDIPNIDNTIYKSRRTNGGWGYYIDRNAAKKLLSLNTPIRFTADSTKEYRDTLNLLCLNEIAVCQNKSLDSSIGQEFRSDKPLYKRIVRKVRNNLGIIFEKHLRHRILKQRKTTVPSELIQ